MIAELAGEVVAHVMFSRSLLDAPRRLVAVQVLSPLGVRPDHQRRGIGCALVRYGLQLLGERCVPLVFVEGDPRYYARLGFTPGAARSFRKPSLRIPDDAFQVVALSAYLLRKSMSRTTTTEDMMAFIAEAVPSGSLSSR